MTMERIHRVRGAAPWGDYGRILVHGMTTHLAPTADGRLRLERCAPFLPAATFPGFSLLVTPAIRERIESGKLLGVAFREVEKARIVALSWERWDRIAAAPEEYPETGEPEDYVLGRQHDDVLAAGLGAIFQVLPSGQCTVKVDVIEHPPPPAAPPPSARSPFTGEVMPLKGRIERRERLLGTDGSDFYQRGSKLYVSDRARTFLESEWLTFETLAT